MSHGEKMRPSNNAPASVSRNESSQGKCTSRNSSTPMAITAEIDAICRRGRRDAAIATRKNSIVAHSTEPPYLTNRPGSPRLNPNLRRLRPRIMIARQRPMRAIVGDRCRSARLFPATLFIMKSHRSPGASARTRFPAQPREGGSAPPWASSMARTMARPIPVPPLSRRVVKKLSKICGRLSGETPSPLSATLIRSLSSAAPPKCRASCCHGAWRCRRGWKR